MILSGCTSEVKQSNTSFEPVFEPKMTTEIHKHSSVNWCKSLGTSEYDQQIKRTWTKYFPWHRHDWCKGKTLAFVENTQFDPSAESDAGALGIYQVMPFVFPSLAEKVGCNDPRDPVCQIKTGIYHIHSGYTLWIFDRDNVCHWNLTYGTFNAGRGKMLRKQHNAHGELCISAAWELDEETYDYIDRINEIVNSKGRKLWFRT